MKRSQLLKQWDRINSSFWFLPAVMACAAVALAFVALALDRGDIGQWVQSRGFGYGGTAEGASIVLQTIASSMINIAGVVFSLTLVALSLASTQFGPQLLRNFMRDTTNQLVLGVFVATFLYCILVLREVRRGDDALFVPHVSVAIGVALAVASLAVLVYFIHHVATSIQADEMIARVGAELDEGIERMFPRRIGEAVTGIAPTAAQSRSLEGGIAIAARSDGYVQRIDPDDLMEVASRHDLVIRVEARPGDYVVSGTPLATVPAGAGAQACEEVAAAFALGAQRTPMQDLTLGIQQLAGIAVRALSPGINDASTPIACIDRLAAALRRLASREPPAAHRADADGRLRVIATPPTFAELVDATFDPIRRHGRDRVAVMVRLLEAIAIIAPAAHNASDRRCLGRQADIIIRGLRESVREPEDLQSAERAYNAALAATGPGT